MSFVKPLFLAKHHTSHEINLRFATSVSALAEDQRLLRCFALQSKVSSAKATARKRASCIEFSAPKIIKLV